jgi:hypothetical protein
VRREADAPGGVDRQADVTHVGKRRTPAVRADSQPHVVPAGGHLATAGLPHRGAHSTADVREQAGVSIVESRKQLG